MRSAFVGKVNWKAQYLMANINMKETCPYEETCENYGIREDCSKETLTRCRTSRYQELLHIRIKNATGEEPTDYERPEHLNPML